MVSGHASVTWLLRSCSDWLAGLASSVLSFPCILCCIVPPSVWGSFPVSVRGWSFRPTTGDIIVTLLSHRCDVIMQHAAAEGDNGTFPSGSSHLPTPARYYDDTFSPTTWHYDLLPSVSLLVSGARAGSTNEVAGNSLNQPITMFDRSRSSNRIWAAPMKDLWSIRP